MNIGNILSDLVENVLAFIVLIVLGIISFFLTVFVVDFGSQLAGYSPSADFMVLSASLIVVASIIAGALR